MIKLQKNQDFIKESGKKIEIKIIQTKFKKKIN